MIAVPSFTTDNPYKQYSKHSFRILVYLYKTEMPQAIHPGIPCALALRIRHLISNIQKGKLSGWRSSLKE